MFSCSVIQLKPKALRGHHPLPSQMFLYCLAMDIAQSVPDCPVSFIDNGGAVHFNRSAGSVELF